MYCVFNDMIFVVEFEGVIKIFGKVNVFEDVDLVIQFGKLIVLFGFNGVGKMIVICILFGLFCFDVGMVKFFGCEFKGLEDWMCIGVMFQIVGLLNMLCVVEFVDFFCSYYVELLSIDEVVDVVLL